MSFGLLRAIIRSIAYNQRLKIKNQKRGRKEFK
jgi:hypothetical protein